MPVRQLVKMMYQDPAALEGLVSMRMQALKLEPVVPPRMSCCWMRRGRVIGILRSLEIPVEDLGPAGVIDDFSQLWPKCPLFWLEQPL